MLWHVLVYRAGDSLLSCDLTFETGTRTFLPWDRSCPRLSPNTKGRGDYVEKTSHALFSFTAPLCFSRNGFKIAAYCFYRRAGTLSHAKPGHIDSLPQVTAAIVLSSYAARKGGHAPAATPLSKNPLSALAPCKRQQKSGQPVTANRLFLLWCARRDSNSWPTGS